MKTIYAIVSITFLCMLLAGCTTYQEATTPVAEDAGRIIVIKDYHLAPNTATVNNGTRVTWQNLDRDGHTIEFNGEESRLLGKGQSFSILATQPGTYTYHSGNHPFINGTLIVK